MALTVTKTPDINRITLIAGVAQVITLHDKTNQVGVTFVGAPGIVAYEGVEGAGGVTVAKSQPVIADSPYLLRTDAGNSRNTAVIVVESAAGGVCVVHNEEG